MSIRSFFAASFLFLAACANGPQAAPTPSGLELVDFTDEFAAFQARSEGMEDEARVAAFKSYFANALPGFYSNERVSFPGYDGLILQALQDYPEDRAGIEEVSRRFASLMGPAEQSFEAAFGPMTGYPPIYLVHSLSEFDGGTRNLAGDRRLLFGADMIARLHMGHDIAPFVHHELFHLYHSRAFEGCDAVWCGLWREGLAVHVAAELNPGASDAELVLTMPVPLRAAVEQNRNLALCTVLAKLDSEESADLRALFSGGKPETALPPRYGYYVGYLVAAEAGKSRSLQKLASLPADEVRPLVEQTLRELATCPA